MELVKSIDLCFGIGFLIHATSKENVLIFVEGKNDEKLFQRYAEQNKISDYKFIECGSADNVYFAIKSFSVIPYFSKIVKEKVVIGLFDFDKQGYHNINKASSKTREIMDLTKKKKPVIIDSGNIYLMALVPHENFNHWDKFESLEGSNGYRLEELKKEGDIGIKRQFDAFEGIVEIHKL